jgi:ABC-type transport system involved in cytochrome bd biosynthesis fused ATPase/permease subunit
MWAFLGATVIQAGAHGAMAASAGLLGQALVGRQFVARGALVDSPPCYFSPIVLALCGLGAALVKAGAGAASLYAQKGAAFRVGSAVRREVADAILAGGRASRSAAEAHAALAIRLREVERGVDEGLLSGLRAALSLVPLALALVFLSSRLALAALAVLGPFALALGWARRRLRATHRRAFSLAEQLHESLDELVRHLDLWRTYGAAPRIRQALEASAEQAGRAAARAEAARALMSGANEVLAAGALLAVVGLCEAGGLGLGQGPLVAFAAVFFLMYRPLRDLGDARTAADRGAQALEVLDELRPPDLPRAAGGTVLHSVRRPRTQPWPAAPLLVCDLSVVRGEHATPPTSLEAGPGEIVVLVGPTGRGKTSLLRALLGLERDVTGTIRYGSLDLTGAGVGPGERPFVWVPQEPAILRGTLATNIALGVPREAERDPREALGLIGASSLIGREAAPVTAGGPELSGGERQWVAIARALATGLPVLLLDEPTAGLDPLSQERVLDALAALRGKRTVILVTHRPEPLAIADRVVDVGSSERSTFPAPGIGDRDGGP